MDFRRKTRQRVERKAEYENLEQKYPLNVTIYKLPPTEDIKIQEFEDLALERLKVLRIFDLAGKKGFRLLSDEWKEFINAELLREGLKDYLRLCDGGSSHTTSSTKKEAELQARRRDYISHFILRLVYCRSDDLRRWFLSHELELFKYKFSSLSSNDIKQFLELNKLNYVPLTEKQKDEVKDGLYESTAGHSVAKIELLDFYKVPFTQVYDLVRGRRCFLKDGYAYVNTNDFVSIVAVMQLNEIEHGLESARRRIKEIETDERILYLLKSLHTSYTGKDYTLNKEASVPIESLDQLSKKSFPLCMRDCHDHIRAKHHIKYGGRMQYGLFLKGAGVTLEGSLRFWREEFTKIMDCNKFEKNYEYNIYHNYGKKGSMINYSPYSCNKIIQDSIAPGDAHGCPYKKYDPSTLKTKLIANGVSAAHVQEIMSYVTKGHYQLACGKYFQIVHESLVDVGINHPNQYFEESQTLMGNRTEKKNDKLIQRKAIKRNANDKSMFPAANDDDELWNIAETQENQYRSQQAEQTAWDEDLDLTAIDC
ncbi:DNA primase large subunit-like [Teleopsis dalmanni]|uniref:DNA primase large subunit-like n=1 Tax=Teleopsis dalmanni TaxID=139649 RepID=UPI0018CFEAFE|nr:DNA primase large subunit-like [Teleopsis dalmanni]